jgi:anaerobic selenocysteine-containing dehydrogenase
LRWGRSTVETACPLDCPDTCSLAVSVEKGRLTRIDGSHRQAVTGGYICSKVRRFGDRVYGSDRLHRPGMRVGARGEGRFRDVSWDEALDAVATRMREVRERDGSEAILPVSYGGSNGLVTQDTADAELFRGLGAARLARTVCAAPTTAVSSALYGRMPGVAYADYRHARLIIVWGANPSVSSIHLVPHIHAAMNDGAALVVIDPRRTALARQADIHLAVRPGTDVAVALALHRFLFENGLADEEFLAAHTRGADALRERAAAWTVERAAAIADVDPELIVRVAELYAETSPAVIRCGWGLERNRNGGNAAAAVLALPAVGGKFGVRGGGFSMSNSGAWPLDPEAWIEADEPDTRLVNMNRLGRALTEYRDPPVQMLFVYNANPAVTMPDQNRVLRGLGRDDLFTVVFDQVMTDTARWADVVLPATTFLEHYDIARSYGAVNLQLVQPVIEPVGDSRPNVEVFAALAARLGLPGSGAAETDPEALMHVTGAMPEPVRDSLLRCGTAEPLCPVRPVQFDDVFPRTPDGRVDLFPEALERCAPAGLYAYRADAPAENYPLVLLSPASEKTVTSTLGELRPRLAALQIHPRDAEARHLGTGNTVRVFNALGEIHCPVMLNPDMKPGTVGLPKGLWRKSTMNGSTANALVADAPTDIGGGACFNDVRVEVTRVVTATLGDRDISIWTIATERTH